MGYTNRPGTGIYDYWPDDTDTEFFIDTSAGSLTLPEIQRKIEEKWPGVLLDDITIVSEHICTYYGSADDTNFIVARRQSVA